jgi:hypothetical protein
MLKSLDIPIHGAFFDHVLPGSSLWGQSSRASLGFGVIIARFSRNVFLKHIVFLHNGAIPVMTDGLPRSLEW